MAGGRPWDRVRPSTINRISRIPPRTTALMASIVAFAATPAADSFTARGVTTAGTSSNDANSAKVKGAINRERSTVATYGWRTLRRR